MKIQYKDFSLETKKGESLPKEFLVIIKKIEDILEIIKDQIGRGVLKIK